MWDSSSHGVGADEPRAGPCAAGVVDQQVDARMPLEDACRGRRDLLAVGDVARLVFVARQARAAARARRRASRPRGELPAQLGADAGGRPVTTATRMSARP